MKCRASLDELRHDMQNIQLTRELENAQESALKLLNTGMFDSDTVREALEQDKEWWKFFLEQIQNDPMSAGIKLRCAVYDQLVKQELGNE